MGEIQSRHNFEKLKVFSHPRTFLLARNHRVRLLVVVVVVIGLVVVVAVVGLVVVVAVVVVVVAAVVVNLVNVVTCKSEKVHCCVFYASKKKFFSHFPNVSSFRRIYFFHSESHSR